MPVTRTLCTNSPDHICPYCGHVMGKNQSQRDMTTPVYCPQCRRKYTLNIRVKITYTTTPEGGWIA